MNSKGKLDSMNARAARRVLALYPLKTIRHFVTPYSCMACLARTRISFTVFAEKGTCDDSCNTNSIIIRTAK